MLLNFILHIKARSNSHLRDWIRLATRHLRLSTLECGCAPFSLATNPPPEMLQVRTNLQTRVILSEVLEAKDLTLHTKLIYRIKTQSETPTSKPLGNHRRKTLASSFASQTSLRMTAFGGCSDFVSLIPKMWVMQKEHRRTPKRFAHASLRARSQVQLRNEDAEIFYQK